MSRSEGCSEGLWRRSRRSIKELEDLSLKLLIFYVVTYMSVLYLRFFSSCLSEDYYYLYYVNYYKFKKTLSEVNTTKLNY